MTSNVRKLRSRSFKAARTPAAISRETDPTEIARRIEDAYNDVYLQALSIVRKPETAEDIVQQVVADTLSAVNEGTKIENLQGWLHSCAYRLALKQVTRQVPAVELEDDKSYDKSRPLAELAHLSEELRRVREAVDRLPKEGRLALLLADVHGLSYSEVAEALGKAENSIGPVLSRARRFVRAEAGLLDRTPLYAPLLGAHFQMEDAGGSSLTEWIAARVTRIQHSLQVLAGRVSETIVQVAQPSVAFAGCAAIVAVCAGLSAEPLLPPNVSRLGSAGPAIALQVDRSIKPAPRSNGSAGEIPQGMLTRPSADNEARRRVYGENSKPESGGSETDRKEARDNDIYSRPAATGASPPSQPERPPVEIQTNPNQEGRGAGQGTQEQQGSAPTHAGVDYPVDPAGGWQPGHDRDRAACGEHSVSMCDDFSSAGAPDNPGGFAPVAQRIGNDGVAGTSSP